jgi:hypothetical protein
VGCQPAVVPSLICTRYSASHDKLCRLGHCPSHEDVFVCLPFEVGYLKPHAPTTDDGASPIVLPRSTALEVDHGSVIHVA